MSTMRILAWGIVAAILAVVVFVRAPEKSNGLSGGQQASMIINAAFKGVGNTIRAAEGYELG